MSEDGLTLRGKFFGLGQNIIPAKTQMSSRPLNLKLQNMFKPIRVVLF